MSDIKYIIAGSDDGGEHTRFGCLAMVRYAVAAVVTVLTITVIALSIHAVLRSEDMGLSVNKGFIGADTLWSHMFSPNAVTSKSPLCNTLKFEFLEIELKRFKMEFVCS